MKIVVIANDAQREEWLVQGQADAVQVEWLSAITSIDGADCYIDLLFTNDEKRIQELTALSSLIIVNAVTFSQNELPENFVRINGWSTFLKRSIVEASVSNEKIKEAAEKIFAAFNKKTEWVQGIAGFVSARVISQIINEAYFTLDEKVSTKDEIDTAMKLGTNYPYGPFEWSNKIGLKNIYALLIKLSAENSRYEPSALLKKEAAQA